MNNSDEKLLHLVKKFASLTNLADGDHIVHCIRTQHREYQRKDITKLKRQVQKLLKNIPGITPASLSTTTTTITATTAMKNPKDGKSSESVDANSTRKRALDDSDHADGHDDDDVEDEYEKKARIHDEQRSLELGNSSVLNSNLIERYRKLSKEREAEARAAAAMAAAATTTTTVDSTPTPKDSGGDMSALVKSPHESATTKSTTNKQLKRKKNASARRLGSSSTAPGGVENGSEPGLGPAIEAVPRPSERYSDLGGMEDILQQIRQLVEYPLVRPELYRYLGVDPPRGVLLRGPPGCGKTHLANAIAGQLGVAYFRVSAPELVSGMSGESEARIRDLFQAASDAAPSIVFMDELDAIAPKRNDGGSSRGMEKRMVAQLLTSLDMLDPKYNKKNAPVIVLGATNRADSIDPALRRAGRFDKEILLGVPDEEARIAILKTMTKGMKLDGDFDLKVLARQTPGYVGADIRSLTKEAAVNAINRIFKNVLKDEALPSATTTVDEMTSDRAMYDETDIMSVAPLTEEQMRPLCLTMDDFIKAIPNVQPSSQREGFATVPGVSWDDIGALSSIREELTLSVLEPIRNPEKFKLLGIPLPAGVMLYGPPGCGKTLLAKAIANESGANFISVKGPELLDKYVGESERSVRLVFERARASSPCVVFFDELDSLCRKRGSDDGGGSGVSERVVNQLLTEMDGLESRRNVFVIAATNRPELIDPAMMRPGRLDKLLYVPLPTPNDRVSILKALSTNVQLSPEVDLVTIGQSARADGYSGADCAALLREAGLAVLKGTVGDADPGVLAITPQHFDYAFDHVIPSVSKKDQARYNRMRDRMAHARSRGAVVSETTVALSEPNEDPMDVHIEEMIEATTTNGVIMAGDASQLSNVSEPLEGKNPNTLG